jgi:LysM repeat protein
MPVSDKIHVEHGRKILNKKSLPRKTNATKPKPIIYLVKSRNTLSSIAIAFNVETCDIRKWNKLKSNKVFAGTKLKIYPKAPLERVRYTVKKGDTISEIAEEFGVRPSHIISCNGMTNGWDIKTVQTLTFYRPVKPKPIIYVVKKGTNLSFISEAYKVDVEEIMEWNNLRSPVIHPGQKLKIYQERTRDI